MLVSVTQGDSTVPLAADTAEPEENLPARAAMLCEQAAAVIADPPPLREDVLWLAEQLADTARLLGQSVRAGTIAAAAYERGRLDEQGARPLPA